MEPLNLKKKSKKTTKREKKIVTCDVEIAQCEDEIVKCEKSKGTIQCDNPNMTIPM